VPIPPSSFFSERKMCRKKRAAKRWIDPDDGPELTKEMAERADLYHGNRLVRPGKGGPNPRGSHPSAARVADLANTDEQYAGSES